MSNHVKKDPQNPYRTGVLCGNYVEDKFGVEIATNAVSIYDKTRIEDGADSSQSSCHITLSYPISTSFIQSDFAH